MPQRTGYALIASAALLWAFIGVFSGRLLAAGISATEIAFWRAAGGGALFVIHGLVASNFTRIARRDWPLFIVFGLTGVTLFYTSLNLAIEHGGVSLAFILLYSAPAFVAVLAAVFLGEAFTRTKALLVVMSIAGVVLVAQSSGEGMTVSVVAVLWGLTAGLTYSSYYLFGKKLLEKYEIALIYGVIMPIGAVGLLPVARFEVFAAPAVVWVDIALLAVLSTYVAYLVYYRGLREVEASRAVLVATIEPVLAAVLAALFFGERLGWLGIVGAVLVLGASVLAAFGPVGRGVRDGAGSV